MNETSLQIDPIVLLIAGSAAAVAIVVLAAYKGMQGRAQTAPEVENPPISIEDVSNTNDTPSSKEASSEEDAMLGFEPAIPPTNQDTVYTSTPSEVLPEIKESPTNEISIVATSNAIPTNPLPEQTASNSLEQNTPVASYATSTFTEPSVESPSSPSDNPDHIQEAPSPFPEESFAPQTPAPTDVSAVASIAAPSTSATPPAPVLVIATPKRKTNGKTRKIPNSSTGIPRKRRTAKSKQDTADQSAGFASSSGSINDPK